MIDNAYLRYVMNREGISRLDLIDAQGWSETTYTNKVVRGKSEWTVSELRVLKDLGASADDLSRIFFE